MKLQTEPFEKALAQLRKSMDYLQSQASAKDPELSAQFRAACIQGFEYSYELAVKMIRRQLSEMVASPQELSQLTFADVMRAAGDAGLIPDVKRFLVYRDARNQTSHTYDENTAEEVIHVLADFLQDAAFLLHQLQQRNS